MLIRLYVWVFGNDDIKKAELEGQNWRAKRDQRICFDAYQFCDN